MLLCNGGKGEVDLISNTSLALRSDAVIRLQVTCVS
jgi:hypothetical protein